MNQQLRSLPRHCSFTAYASMQRQKIYLTGTSTVVARMNRCDSARHGYHCLSLRRPRHQSRDFAGGYKGHATPCRIDAVGVISTVYQCPKSRFFPLSPRIVARFPVTQNYMRYEVRYCCSNGSVIEDAMTLADHASE